MQYISEGKDIPGNAHVELFCEFEILRIDKSLVSKLEIMEDKTITRERSMELVCMSKA